MTTINSQYSTSYSFGHQLLHQCLYPADIGSKLEIISGYWVSLPSNSCTINATGTIVASPQFESILDVKLKPLLAPKVQQTTRFCNGVPLYDESMHAHEVYVLPHCHFQMFEPASEAIYNCLNDRPLLFLGDSTTEYIFGPSFFAKFLNDTMWAEKREFEFHDHNNSHRIDAYYRFCGHSQMRHNHLGLESFLRNDFEFFTNVLDPQYFNNYNICITEVVLVCNFFIAENHFDIYILACVFGLHCYISQANKYV